MIDEDNDPRRPRPPSDSRGFFMLPQASMDSGYYVYGNLHGRPAKGAYQYAHPLMMTSILKVALEWQAIDKRRFGVGDISLPGGIQTPDHGGHKSGLNVDIRPLRKDGREEPVAWNDPQYDQIATYALIKLFQTYAPVQSIIFNDPGIPFLVRLKKHDDHFHLNLRG
jgi:penicillin-insensitive murein endopeptidase